MLIFNKNAISSNNKISNISKNSKGKKTKKKVYKSIGKGEERGYSRKSVGGGGRSKKKSEVRKKISKKNTQFLEGLGLKVKQKQ